MRYEVCICEFCLFPTLLRLAQGRSGGGQGKVGFPAVSLLPPLGGGLLSPLLLSPGPSAAAAAASSKELDLSGPPFYDEINPDVEDDHARGRDVEVEDGGDHLERDVVDELGLAPPSLAGGGGGL